MNATQAAEQVTLYFKEGSSDKVYAAQLEPKGSGWVVNFQYGRRGSTMNTGTKTSSPLPFEKAKSIFDKLVHEKTAKGYTPGEDGTAYKHTTNEQRDTGERPQLLNEVDEAEVEKLINDPAWGMQEKKDGKRMMVRKTRTNVSGINRKGLTVGLPEPVALAVAKGFTDGLLDGEAVGDTLFVFDLLDHEGSTRDLSYADRHKLLSQIGFSGSVQVVPLAVTAKEKRTLYKKVKDARGEGVVFKLLAGKHKPGRPAAGGDHLKYKFYATGSFIVSKVNAKRSVALELADGTPIGNVTITPNKAVPKVGDIVEIKYLYCYKGGSLYQPQFLEVRDDIDRDACTAAQIKFKAADEDDDA